MTIIAWSKKHGVAVDSQMTSGDSCAECVKYFAIGDGMMFGAGNSLELVAARNALLAGKSIKRHTNRELIFVRFSVDGKTSELFHLYEGKFPDNLMATMAHNHLSQGSGRPYADVALNAGMTPKEAVQLACRYENTCGGHVHVFNNAGDKIQ